MYSKSEQVDWKDRLQELSVTQRSHLHSIKPIGVGTAYVESLTSYITNLAKSHWVSVGSLLSEKFAPIIGKNYLTNGSSRGLHKIYNRAGALNGVGVMAKDWVETTQALTLQDNLHLLTLLSWSDVLPPRKLLRQCKAWCPRCYEIWKISGLPIYEPLIWAVYVVELCPRHHYPLSTQCHHCSRQQPFLDWRSQLGYCSKCGQWLGDDSDNRSHEYQNIEQHEIDWQLWVAKNVGQLLSAKVQLPLSEKVAESTSTCIKKTTDGNIAEFARMLNLPKNTVWQWQAGQVIPPLRELLRICHLVSVPLIDFLTKEDLEENLSKSVPVRSIDTAQTTRAPGRTFAPSQICKSLEAELLSHSCPPPTLKKVAERLGYAVRVLREHFPELCCAIAVKAKGYRLAQRKQRVEKLNAEVQKVALELHSQGILISQANVSKHLTQPGAIRDPQARLALQRLQHDLLHDLRT